MNQKLKKKIDEKVAQPLIAIRPSAEQCKNCVYAYPDTQYTVGAEKAYCEMYEPPEGKPAGVLVDETKCPLYEERSD